MATLYRATGEVVEVRPANGDFFTMEEMKALVGGYITIIRDPRLLIVNEYGLAMGLPTNKRASVIAHQRLVGDVVEMTVEEMEAAQ